MKYGRGRIIALAILSVTIVLALFGAGFLYNFRDSLFRAAIDPTTTDPSYIPTFDDLYERIPFDATDTGTTQLGQSTKLTLLEERYNRGVLTEFLNAEPANTRSYRDLQSRRLEGYPYPLYSNTDMMSIANGMGNNLDIPVVMLDPYNYDDVVLFELTDLVEMPTSLIITRDGDPNAVKIQTLDNSYSADQVYQGVPNYTLIGMSSVVYDTDNETELLYVNFVANTKVSAGYTVEIRDTNNNFLYTKNAVTGELSELKTLETGSTKLYDANGVWCYDVVRDGSSNSSVVTIFNASSSRLGDPIVFNKSEHQLVNYNIGAVAYNSQALRGMFREQGTYEITFKQKIAMGDGVYTSIDVSFAFIIVNKINYTDFPRFNTDNRVVGYSEIYNYSYESEYPTVTYSKLYFDVQIVTTAEYYQNDAEVYDERELRFYNIGSYQMISTLQYWSEYLNSNRQTLSSRGVNNGYITLKRYTQYSSQLNILGFQAYYGGQHTDAKYSGPLPFYDSENSEVSSDISEWVRSVNMTAEQSGAVVDYSNMRVSDALKYSTELANYITTNGTITPVRTNFPPVKMYGNVAHATGTGTNGEKAVVLSTVAYRPSYGTGHTSEWKSSSLEVGAPFEDAGEYVVTIYFKVNGEMCQQTFYFEIVNAAKIAFEVTSNGETKTFYIGELELNQDLQEVCIAGNQIKLSYDGATTLGQFEVLPTITLAYAEFGKYTYIDQNIEMGEDGSFGFYLKPGQYRLTVKYGAHGKSTTVMSLVVDDTQASGIKANTSAKSLAETYSNLPANVDIVGTGDVTLTWKSKDSGIGFNNVICEYYEMAIENSGVDPNKDKNYDNFPTTVITNMYSASAFSQTSSSPNNGYHPVQTEDGWTLDEVFSTAGLYRFTLIDDVGNVTPYVLIIDDSIPTFVQGGEEPTSISNVVNLDDLGVKVGFGTNKLIKHQNANTFSNDYTLGDGLYQSIFTGLSDAGVLVNTGTRAISIPLARVEYNNSGSAYQDVTQDDMRNGYIVLNQEGTYYFRVTDVLGNVGEYYIVLTYDRCFGTVYADADASQVKISVDANHIGRGMVTAEPNASTSLVTSTGGMTNRPYVTFSFKQRGEADGLTFRVGQVVMQYYPLNYQLTSTDDPEKENPNYPFAEYPKNNPKVNDASNGQEIFANQDYDGVIYTYDSAKDSAGGTIRLALFNTGTSTPTGMYILTRTYVSVSGSDTTSRDYYFIVDDQKMLYYADDFQTALKIHFAENKDVQYPKAKDADASVIYKNKNELSSNRTAWLLGFNSKYSWKHDSTTYTINHFNHLAYSDIVERQYERYHNFTFPALTPRFSYENNNQTVTLGEGNNTWAVGDPASRTDSTIYKIVIADNARNISCTLVNGNIVELKNNPDAPTSANWDYLTLNLDTAFGTKADIVLGENKVLSNSRMEYDGNGYLCVVDPRNVDQLQFRFASDPESMYADVDIASTVASWTWTTNGVSRSLSLAVPTASNGLYTFNLMDDFLDGVTITNGASLSVSVLTYDDTRTDYTILFDRYEPNYNLTQVKAGDNLARTLDDSELPGGYVYGLSEDFVFESDRVNNPYLDTKIITYREVDYTGEGSQAAVQFKLYTGTAGETRIPFATLVGLRDNEMRYYFISETDYAGHTTSYIVQIQGENYANAINFIGATSEEGAEIQIGIEMHASSSSVHQFFLRNNSFKFESGDEYYTVLGTKASWHIGDDIGTGNKSEENLINALNSWINTATENGTICSYTLYDRIGDVETFEFYNLRDNAVQMQLDCYQPSATSSIITLEVTNFDNLPRILLDENLASLFQIKVEDRTTKETLSNIYFSLYGTSIYADVTHELVITVTDPFGRVSTTEYHQQAESTISFTTYGNTVTQDNIVYIGDERGVAFNYLRTVYTVLIYDAGTGNLLSDLQSFISGDMIYYTFRPTEGATTIEFYRIVATGRASGAILFDQTFAFDTRLPSVEWTNASDQVIEVEGQSFVSSVNFDISKSLVNTAFPVTISYTRTFDNYVESVTLQPGTEKITFYQVGAYEVTIRNKVWAKQTYQFEIVQIDDTLVLVYDDGNLIEASTSGYKYLVNGNETYITRYIFTTSINPEAGTFYPVYQYQAHGLEIKVGQTNRVLAGNYDEGTDYYYYDPQNSTIVWRLAFLVGENSEGAPVYTSPIYFATTGVSSQNLTDDNSISLELNGNPNLPAGSSTSYTLVASRTAYNLIYENYMTAARGNKLTVKLYCAPSILRDDDGAPCNLVKGNLILVDCYYNGTLVKTMNYNDVFTINQNDAGYYEFEVHDLVGNYLYFGDSSEESNINYRQKRYMLAVMTKPVVVINDKQPVSGMIYNDQVELKLVDYGSAFLTKYYYSLVNSGAITADKEFFNKYFCITEVEITYTGSNTTTTERRDVSGTQTTFYWNKSGNYHILLTYRIYGGGSISAYLTADYSFQIVPSATIRESFSMPLYPDIPIVSVTRDGYNIHDYNIYVVRENNDEYITFNANSNPGSYVITLQAYDSILQKNIDYEVRFNVQHKANSASTYFILSSASGSSTTSAVTLYYNPYWLYLAQGQVTITLTKNYETEKEVVVDRSVLNTENYNSQELFSVSDAGIYRVSVRDAEGDVVYSDSWTIEAKQSTFGYIILSIVLGIAGIGLLLFIRMRHKMTTK